ncbi:MAG: RNA methyltransferase [Thermoanaerobaculia bacterium]
MTESPAVVLVRPSEEGNVGAVARAMANMGLERLILVEPAVPIGKTARARAVGAGEILDGAERVESLEAAIAPFQLIVGTSSHRQRSAHAAPIEPRELPGLLATKDVSWAALVFGPERSGLTTNELALCGTIVRIPTAVKQPTLNLAQAVLIIAHELFAARQRPKEDGESLSPAATGNDLAGLLEHVDSVLNEIGFARDSTYGGVLRDLRRLAGRARLTEREVVILRGLCRRLEHRLERAGGNVEAPAEPSSRS